MKKVALLLIAMMIIGVGFLSGCNELENTSSDVELLNYNVVTKWIF